MKDALMTVFEQKEVALEPDFAIPIHKLAEGSETNTELMIFSRHRSMTGHLR